MQLNKSVNILVFEIDEVEIYPIGEITEFSSFRCSERYSGYGEFELNAPITEKNKSLFKSDHVIWSGGTTAYRIEIVKSVVGSDGVAIYNIQGRSYESWLVHRITWGSVIVKNAHIGDCALVLLEGIYKDPRYGAQDTRRNIPRLTARLDQWNEFRNLGELINYQKTGGDIYTNLKKLFDSYGLGWRFEFDPISQNVYLYLYKGTDRTVINADNAQLVEFSTELDDILESAYYYNDQDFYNICLIAGAGEGINRVTEVVGDHATLTGFDRRELYVDARDLQKELIDENGNQIILNDAEYQATMIQRANEKLGERRLVENFEAKLRMFGNVQYVYNQDYFLGDRVTLRDDNLGVTVSARIEAVEETFSDDYNIDFTFGYEYPTIAEKISILTNRN